MKPDRTRRFLLVAPAVGHETELMEALSRSLLSTDGTPIFELMYLDFSYLADFLLTLDLLRQIRSGLFDTLFIVPSAST